MDQVPFAIVVEIVTHLPVKGYIHLNMTFKRLYNVRKDILSYLKAGKESYDYKSDERSIDGWSIVRVECATLNGWRHGSCVDTLLESNIITERSTYCLDQLHGERMLYNCYSGKLYEKATYIMGKRHGPYAQYFDDGSVRWNLNYVNNVMEGASIVYCGNRSVSNVGHFSNNKLEGEYRIYRPDGTIISVSFYVNGEKCSRIFYLFTLAKKYFTW
jgi:antitoxin component YwqK of YwqJK toxin-antitoxin module